MPPPIIYHYTNDAGLRGILESGKLWLTDIFDLNDPIIGRVSMAIPACLPGGRHPLQIAQFGGRQAVPVTDQDHGFDDRKRHPSSKLDVCSAQNKPSMRQNSSVRIREYLTTAEIERTHVESRRELVAGDPGRMVGERKPA
jgi:hypothetical protein